MFYEKIHEHKTVFAAWFPLREMDRYITQTHKQNLTIRQQNKPCYYIQWNLTQPLKTMK